MKLTIARSLLIFGGVISVGFAASISVMSYSIKQQRVNGPYYQRIVDGKDLLADLIPPPLSVAEAYLLLTEAVAQPDLRDANLKALTDLERSYGERLAYWHDSGLPDDMKVVLEQDIRPLNDHFWKVTDGDLVPALQNGDMARVNQTMATLRDDYHKEGAQRQKLIDMTNTLVSDSETDANASESLLATISYGTAAAMFLLIAAGLFALRRQAVLPITGIADYVTRLARGDFSEGVPYRENQDEIGIMARAVSILRENGMTQQQLERANQAQAAQIEAERAERSAANAARASELQEVIERLGDGLERVSKFNIGIKIDQPFAREFDTLRQDFNTTLTMLQGTIGEVLDRANDISSATSALQNSADQLAKRTEQQAATLEETASAMEEITVNIKNSAARTAATRNFANSAKANVQKSALVVQNAVQAMGRIEEASQQIGSITNVIDEIAFQTNLLALNAGVEAARAGDAGKGFAVVAQEVRALAQRSASAAKDISELISRSGLEVAKGVGLVKEAGTALVEIEQNITGIATDVDAIALSASEQTTGMLEVNTSINHIDQITQQNAAMVEETTAATHHLGNDVQQLLAIVDQFTFERNSSSQRPPARNRAA